GCYLFDNYQRIGERVAKQKPEQGDGDSGYDNPVLPGGLIPIEEWTRAEASVRRTLVGELAHWIEQLRATISRPEEAFSSLDSLPELSDEQLHGIAPGPDRKEHAQAVVNAILALREQGQCRRPVTFLVAPPFSGVSRALRCFPECRIAADTASEHKSASAAVAYQLILPPDNLLMGEDAAWEWWQQQPLDKPWVISELAAFWRRHGSGLALVQALLRRVAQNSAGEGIIGCSSWCWQFWASYYPDAQLAPWMPAPMTTERLGIWLQQLASHNGDNVPVVRMATDGVYVLPLEPEETDGKPHKKRKHNDFLRNLAADSRGIPGIALSIWRLALRARPEANSDDAVNSNDEQAPTENHKQRAHCWVVPLDQLSLPTMPVSSERNLGLVLHALLMHDGLTIADLELVTAVREPDLSLALARLAQADIIGCDKPGQDTAFDLCRPEQQSLAYEEMAPDASWRVTPLGYPGVRRHLQNFGFPVDNF
ncbi:MAG TPA: hypothetical protein VGP45_03890, partial [Marinobacter sp.]|nr:hypothetical protein [Marinobacter sp.]